MTAADLLATVGSYELVEEAGITYRQLDYWTQTGRLKPLPTPRGGSGVPRLYPEEEIAVARALRVLIGFPGHEAICDQIRTGYRGLVEPLPGVVLDLGVICEPLLLSA